MRLRGPSWLIMAGGFWSLSSSMFAQSMPIGITATVLVDVQGDIGHYLQDPAPPHQNAKIHFRGANRLIVHISVCDYSSQVH